MSDARNDGPTGGRTKSPRTRTTKAAAPPPQAEEAGFEDAAADDDLDGGDVRELQTRLARARADLATARTTIDGLTGTVADLRSEVSNGALREAELAVEVERAIGLLDRERQVHEAWVRDALLGSSLDGLSTSLQNFGAALFDKLAPLSALSTLATSGRALEVSDLTRLAAVQNATERIDANSYVTGRATVAPDAPPATPTVAS